ncbi:NAD(P)/FAD-dependent oxidoreductase [Niabella ginsengisoli]|uniref:FAD-binding oxidoreductase n=1 Tax=Niabella ginsengisoli TaxID=522298 RepID=A0ABS9SGW6_9BACT|nr:FAD-dependent oxidoreductase [Niabella ginsengisoli]MCH5597585.1 FAD-binding oxidoreductase [Niabella ginsengisoli]
MGIRNILRSARYNYCWSWFRGLMDSAAFKRKISLKKITIIERSATPSGASGRNAGFACFGSLTEILSDIETIGVEKAVQMLNWRFEGLKLIRHYFNDITIDYQNTGSYELLTTDEPLGQLSYVNGLLYNITGATETFVQKDELIENFGFSNISHLLENRFEGALHPGKLLTVLIQKAIAIDIQIMFGTELKSFEETKAEVKLLTADKRTLTTQQIVFCTNAFSKSLLPDIPIVPARGQILLTEPIAELKLNGVFHFDEGYYYFRNLNGRILLGGARNTSVATEYTLDSITTLPIQQALEDFLNKIILPGQKPAIDSRWAGIMAMGPEKMPIVKALSEKTFCAVRLGGMGVALAPMMGKMLSEMI